MTEDELLFHANYSHSFPPNTIHETEKYGIGKMIRKMANYPSSWPIKIHTDHGPNQWDFVTEHMLQSEADLFGFFSERIINDFKKKSNKKALLLQSPYKAYRERNRIEIDNNAIGSIFFLAHSTFWTDKETNYDELFDFFDKKLPSTHHPVSICLHFVDVQKNRHIPFIKKGFPVYTAGNWEHPYFVENFYEIIKKFQFGFSNSVGSNLFYCVDLGIPYTIIDIEPVIVSNSDPNIISSKIAHKNHFQYEIQYNLFSSFENQINPLQQQFVNEELDPKNKIANGILMYHLYFSYFKFRLNSIFLKLTSLFNLKSNE